MEVAVDRPVCRRDQLWGRREVRHALREVDAAHLAHDPRHLADDGLREPLDPLRDPGRAHAPDAAFVKRWAAAPRWRRPASLPETRASTRRVGGTLKPSERAGADGVVDGRRAGLRPTRAAGHAPSRDDDVALDGIDLHAPVLEPPDAPLERALVALELERDPPVVGLHVGAPDVDDEVEVLDEAKADHGWIALERSEEHTSELQSRLHLVCRLLLE